MTVKRSCPSVQDMVNRRGYCTDQSAHDGQHMMDRSYSTDNRRCNYATQVIIAKYQR